MSLAMPQTPQRPLPGTYQQTPANQQQQTSNSLTQQPSQNGPVASRAYNDLRPVERACQTINDTLVRESQYPELDTYVTQGVSSEYDVSSRPAWSPFQRLKSFDVPERIFEQYNQAQFSTKLGLFADLNHAWIAIDNGLYLWDYTIPDPPLVGFEEQTKQITAVALLWPRAGVFIGGVSRLLVAATTSDVHLIGLAAKPSQTGGLSAELFSTGLQVSTKGIEVSVIAGSSKQGRIFFAGRDSDDVYEVTYQQEERWFQNRCAKINHTATGLNSFAPAPFLSFGGKGSQEYVATMVVDDTRDLLYTLSSSSTIRVFQLTTNNGLSLVITKPLSNTLRDISHMPNAVSELLSTNMSIIAIDPINAPEASRMHLVATTSTGCRLYLSATSSSSFYASVSGTQSAPNSMQVQHVRFPPGNAPQQQQAAPPNPSQPYNSQQNQNLVNSSQLLIPSRMATRFAPGYFFDFVPADPRAAQERLFISSPDTGRIARPPDNGPYRFPELGMWLTLSARAEAIGQVTAQFAAASSPRGFANELATQYDKPTAEIAILTNNGVQTFRKRRLVDIFASTVRGSGGEEGFEAEMKRFIRRYGRGETASTALAVACGQGLDVTSDSRITNITDPDVLEWARKAFIEYGGKPQFYENNVVDQSVPVIDMVHPSPRHEGLALYVTRLVRSIWKAPIIHESINPATKGLVVLPAIPLPKLKSISADLLKLKEFLNANRSFIEGLSGPDALGRTSSKHDEISLQAEHRALHSQVVLVDNIIEGIAFVQVLFDERLEEIVLSLANEVRIEVRNLTYEALFSSMKGRDLAKELVKAIVNRNIANGSNVETVADALRRRCGSFCSADDVVIFKAQEQLKRASGIGADSDQGRIFLNESLKLFVKVAGSLSMEQLQWASTSYSNLQFYAGAIQLALTVAHESDRGSRALSWIEDGRPENDPRKDSFESRKQCYNLIHDIITAIENTSPNAAEGQYSASVQRRTEAYQVIDLSEDEAFQTDLYDWYLSQQNKEQLLRISSPYIVTYLERKSADSAEIADLLWRYHSRGGQNHQAAEVQLKIARSAFPLSLDRRVEYLSLAKANASMPSPGIARQTRYQLLREVSDLLDIASIQSEVLQRLLNDSRIPPERRPQIEQDLNGSFIDVTQLFNEYADQAGYYDLCILIFQASDHRVPTDIRATWDALINRLHTETLARTQADDPTAPLPYEAVSEKIRSLGTRLNLSETMFPINDLLPSLERYAFTQQRNVGPETWVIDTFAQIGVPHESIFPVLEGMFYNDEQPFHGKNRKIIAGEIVYSVKLWLQDTSRGKGKVLGGEVSAEMVCQTLLLLQQSGLLDGQKAEECAILRARIEQAYQ